MIQAVPSSLPRKAALQETFPRAAVYGSYVLLQNLLALPCAASGQEIHCERKLVDERSLVTENFEILLDCVQRHETIIGTAFAQQAPATRRQVNFISRIITAPVMQFTVRA